MPARRILFRIVAVNGEGSSQERVALMARRTKRGNIRNLILAIVLGSALMALVSGCRTAHGFGEDMQNAGDKIQQKTQ